MANWDANWLAELRGVSVGLVADPDSVPCIETSDAALLCKHPLVSVAMVTYNHADYIRQAIEGVISQKTDFEFELVIGEDASPDGTREICFEYQKRFPDKIRILWSEKNVNDIGGNFVRVKANCRGVYVCLCEGDDYWSDSNKLQRQVEAFRANPSLSLAMTGGKLLVDGQLSHCPWFDARLQDGLISGAEFFDRHLKGVPGFMLTASAMYRRDLSEKAHAEYEIFRYGLILGDTTTWLGLTSLGDFWWDSRETVVYRRHAGGITQGDQALVVGIDAALVRMFYENKVLHMPLWRSKHAYQALNCRLRYCSIQPFAKRMRELVRIVAAYRGFLWFYHIATLVAIVLFLMGKKRLGFISSDLFLGFTRKFHRIPHMIWWVTYGNRKARKMI